MPMAGIRPDREYLHRSSPPRLTTTQDANSQPAQHQPHTALVSPTLSSGHSSNTEAEAFAHLRHPPVRMLLPSLISPRIARTPSKGIIVSQILHACESCRKSKSKCSGGQPCERCRTYGNQCIYKDGKRDIEKK